MLDLFLVVLLDLGLRSGVDDDAVDPLGDLERGATEHELVVVDVVLVCERTIFDGEGHYAFEEVKLVVGHVAVN